ncbi:hypothetical protein QTI66_33060 [Variovorax sp. J22R133]|uniref:hypothetical protein n=1 Tax=Variovorax brevis TaxID=3053503 RepID=UPI002578FCD9|nr:hypothetical protein [Variovorax sp. J22R133]MDM0116957.1 hypothetical protein [Variovorax sp. J22R133]
MLELLPHPDAHNSFFDLGGDSLKTGRTAILFEREWGVCVARGRLLYETLSELVNGIERDRKHAQPIQGHAVPETRRSLGEIGWTSGVGEQPGDIWQPDAAMKEDDVNIWGDGSTGESSDATAPMGSSGA